MHINTDISAASNGAYQIRARKPAIPSFDNPNPRAIQAQNDQAARTDAATKGKPAADTVQLSSVASASLAKPNELAATKPAQPPLASVLDAIIKPGEPAEAPGKSESNAAPQSFTMADLETMLELFGQSYDLNDADNADPLLVQYDLNNDGTLDADDLSAMLNLIQ